MFFPVLLLLREHRTDYSCSRGRLDYQWCVEVWVREERGRRELSLQFSERNVMILGPNELPPLV